MCPGRARSSGPALGSTAVRTVRARSAAEIPVVVPRLASTGTQKAVPNLALLRYGGGDEDPHRVCVFNNKGYIHYLLDVSAVILS